MKFKIVVIALISVLISSHAFAAKEAKAKEKVQSVASVVPIIHALNRSLLEGTAVKAIYLPPKRFPVSRISNWLQHKSAPVIAKQGPITAFVTVESVWPELALLKQLRANNIRVIEVDAAKEILPGGAQIRLSQSDVEHKTYFWLAPDNLRVMSQIMARELQRIWPQQADIIRQNQAQLQQQIGGYALKLDQLLLEQNVMAVCIEDEKLRPMAQATYLPIERTDCTDALLIEQQIKPHAKVSQSQPGVWRVNAGLKPINKSLGDWLQGNLENLEQALLH